MREKTNAKSLLSKTYLNKSIISEMHLNDQSRSSLLLIMLRLVRYSFFFFWVLVQISFAWDSVWVLDHKNTRIFIQLLTKFVVVNTFAWKIKGHWFESRWGRKFSLVFCQIKNIWSYLLWRPLVAREHLEVVLIQTMGDFSYGPTFTEPTWEARRARTLRGFCALLYIPERLE